MTDRLQSLLAFHRTRSFGSRENLILEQHKARELYESLTPIEQDELAGTVIAECNKKKSELDSVLCNLSCFHPGSLAPFHADLVRRRIFYPGVIYYGAERPIAANLLNFLEEDAFRDKVLLALAWIGNEFVQSTFAEWRDRPPRWRANLFIPPHEYAPAAGWELTPAGRRRDLFHATAYPLVPRTGEAPPDSVRTGIADNSHCPWCKRQLISMFEFDDLAVLLPNHRSHRVSVLCCDVCAAFGTVFGKMIDGEQAVWHNANTRPKYLPKDSTDWDSFPVSPLIRSRESRHFLKAANWCESLGVSFSQVGGIPTWIQNAEFPRCPDCTESMPFIGQISYEDFIKFGEGIHYAFLCSDCGVTATNYQQS